MKKSTLTFCMSIILFSIAFSQQRVKTITLTTENLSAPDAAPTTRTTVFSYTNNMLSSITVNGNEYATKDLQKNISFQRAKNDVWHSLEINKKGETEVFQNLTLKYQKDGKLRSLTAENKPTRSKWSYDLFFDENKRLAATVLNPNDAARNYLSYFNEVGQCIKVEQGFGTATDEVILAVWENGLLTKLSGYYNRNGFIIHEFFYNEKGLLQKEKIYSWNKEKKETTLTRTYDIQYENGVGNEQKVYFSWLNWKVNLFFGAMTCDYFGYINY